MLAELVLTARCKMLGDELVQDETKWHDVQVHTTR